MSFKFNPFTCKLDDIIDVGDYLSKGTDGSVLFRSGGKLAQDNSNLFWDDSSNFLGVNTNTPLAALDVSQGSGSAILLGADLNGQTRTNENRKFARMTMPHYLNAEQPVAAFTLDSDGTDNIINYGGGSTQANTVTEINFYTASNDTTTTGTRRMRMDSSGNVAVGSLSSIDGRFDIQTGSGIALLIGANVNSTSRSNNVRKFFRIGMPHYSTSEQPTGVLIGDSNSSTATLNFGGGSSSVNAPTNVNFYTAANTTTTTGTKRMGINSDGVIEVFNDFRIDADSKALVVGASQDAGIMFNGTDMITDYDLLNSGTTDYRIQEDGVDMLTVLAGGVLQTHKGRISNTSRYTTTQTLDATDEIVFANTDGSAWTLSLPAGVEGTHYKIINCGTSGNDLTVDPNGTEQLYGGGAGVAQTLSDGEVINIHYNATEGWY